MNFSRWVCILLAFLSFAAVDACACSCFEEGGCHKLAIHAAMFVGQALSVTNNDVDPATAPFRKRTFRFRVVETFAGKENVGDVVEIETGMGGGDCGYGFAIGSSYLVDAYESQSRLTTSICSATQPETEAGLALNELRTREQGKTLPDLSGTISILPGSAPDKQEYKPLPGAAVTLTDSRGVEQYHQVSDETGIFTFARVVPGTYLASFRVPTGYVATYGMEQKIGVAIPDVSGTGASCHLNVNAQPAATITGRLVDKAGNGVEGFVAAYPVTQNTSYPWAAASPTDKQGNFTLVYLRDGDYRLEYSGAKGGKGKSPASVHDHLDISGVTLALP